MSSKISALPGATTFSASDVLDCLSGGVNKKMVRSVFLTFLPTEVCNIQANAGSFQIDGAGVVNVSSAAGQPVTVSQTGGSSLTIDNAGSFLMTIIGAFALVTINGPSGSTFQMLTTGAINIFDTSGASAFVTYVPNLPADWTFSPTDLATAIDRIARAINLRTLGGPIP